MQKNSPDFSMQEALRLANSDAGRELLALFSQMDSDKRERAAAQAAAGDYAQVKKTLSELLSSPQAKALMKQLEGK